MRRPPTAPRLVPDDRRSALFVLNPASGSHDADETEAAIVDRLEEAGTDVEVRRTEGEGDARRWAGEAADDEDVDLLVVAGGDGSVREAVSGVVAADGDVPIAIVATGTANLLARALEIPADDPPAAADVEVRRTEGEGDARRWAGEAADDEDVDLLVVAGGDGSVREAVSGVVAADGDVPIAIVATGTANLLARALEIPADDPPAAADVAAEGTGRTIDVIHIVDRDDHAVIMVDAGFDAQLVRDSDRGNKDALGPFAYVAAGIRNLFELEQVELEVELDGEMKAVEAHTVMCINIGRIGQTVIVDHDIEPDDGSLHVGIASKPGAMQAARTALEMVVDERDEQANVAWSSCRTVRISADPPLQLQVDGDPAGETPFELELLPAAVTVLVPADESG